MGFPIQKSPDHSLLAAPRSLSQLTTSFFAYLCLGIHTHALSSLTIKSTSHTTLIASLSSFRLPAPQCRCTLHSNCAFLLVFIMPVNIQLSKISIATAISMPIAELTNCCLTIDLVAPDGPAGLPVCWLLWWAQMESNHRPHPYQGCALAI